MSYNEIDIMVNGERLQVDLTEELSINDLDKDMSEVAAKMAYWGAVWAAAEAEQERVDAHYRKWRAEVGNKASGPDGKASEWKVKQAIEASPDFIKYKDSAAKALQNATLARAVFESFRTKANLLQSKGARERAEFGATGMVTKERPSTEQDPDEKTKRGISAMREANKKKLREE